jgi:hypothetical protein
MSKFATKKKLLAAESEAYRQLLKLELETFKVYGVRTKRRLTSLSAYAPLLMAGFPAMMGLFRGRKKKSSFGRLASLFAVGWKTYQQLSPMFRRGRATKASEAGETAAQEYLAKRL